MLYLQEDDAIPVAAGLDEPYFPDQAEPLPRKQDPPDSASYSSSSSRNTGPPPPPSQGVGIQMCSTN